MKGAICYRGTILCDVSRVGYCEEMRTIFCKKQYYVSKKYLSEFFVTVFKYGYSFFKLYSNTKKFFELKYSSLILEPSRQDYKTGILKSLEIAQSILGRLEMKMMMVLMEARFFIQQGLRRYLFP